MVKGQGRTIKVTIAQRYFEVLSINARVKRLNRVPLLGMWQCSTCLIYFFYNVEPVCVMLLDNRCLASHNGKCFSSHSRQAGQWLCCVCVCNRLSLTFHVCFSVNKAFSTHRYQVSNGIYVFYNIVINASPLMYMFSEVIESDEFESQLVHTALTQFPS